MAGNPTEELELLERVLLRLGYADTDEQLQTTVNKFLTPVLIKITSPNENVRKKVMEILTHINKRLKSRNQIQIPLTPLLAQYQQADSLFLINFAIIYITMGFPRLTIAEQTEFAPVLLNCLEGKPESHQDRILMLVLPLLGEIKIPEDPESRAELLGLSNKPHTKQQLLSILMDVLLLPYGTLPDSDVPPGMSVYSFKRVTAKPPKAEELEQLKKGIVRFLCGGIFPEPDILAHLVVASADTRFSVATPAIGELNKICSSLEWTDPKLSTPLYTLFTGNGSKLPDRKTSGVSARVRQKLLQHLLKCRGKGIIVANGIQVIFESLFGVNTNQKCKVLALQFAYKLINNGETDLLNKIAKVLLTGLAKLIGTTSEEPNEVQNAAYSAIAQLATVCPTAVNEDLHLVGQYFNHLKQAPVELHSSIREALVALAQAFDWRKQMPPGSQVDTETTDQQVASGSKKGAPKPVFVPNANQHLLLALLAENAESKLSIVQNVASVFLITCFPDFYVPSRYLLLIICGESPQLREMMTTYLYGVSKKDHVNYGAIFSVEDCAKQQSTSLLLAEEEGKKNPLAPTNEPKRIVLPSFCDMVEYVSTKSERKVATIVDRMGYGKVKLPYGFDTYLEILDYLRICMLFNAGVNKHPSVDDEDTFKLTAFLRKLVADGHRDTIVKYHDLVRRLVIARKGITELTCLYDLVNAIPDELVEENRDLLLTLEASLKEISEPTRILIAKVYGILLAYVSNDEEFDRQVKELQTLGTKSLETRHGSILAASNAVYRKLLLKKNARELPGEGWNTLKDLIELLASLLNEQQSLLQSAGIRSLCLVGSCSVLPLPEEDPKMETDGDEKVKPVKMTKALLMETLMTLLQSAHTKAKIREDAAHCLGYLAVGDREYYARKVLSRFLGLLKMTKDPALHIAMGQALAYTLQGLPKCETADGTVGNVDDDTLSWFLIELVKQVNETHAYLKQACAIWLLAIVKNCTQRRPVQEHRQILQLALTDLLWEDNELIQDVASRAMGIIFSLSDNESQEEMSNLLIDQLIGGRRQVQKVAADTKLFEEGVLGKAPTGGNLSTYKELCSLASDLNQPEMIYQFMQLANHNATWNSKLGAAFGLQSISKSAKQKMEPHLGKIVPRLFRYKYDPTPKIQNQMITIWDTVVSDSKATIEQYYWEILDDVSQNLTCNEWRTRIACCLAVRDLIKRSNGLKLRSDTVLKRKASGNEAQEEDTSKAMDTDLNPVPEPELQYLWSQLFRVMDDIHEGTRLAAEGTANVLSKVCVVAASSDHSKSGLNVASSIIPLFLEKGVTNTVLEIRRLSIRTLSELIDSAGALILPHLTSLVPCLLQATGELDSTKLATLSTMLSGQSSSGTQEAIDSLRAEAAKQHYTMETLTKCIRHIDYVTMERMTPAVLDLLKTSVSLGTKVACAHFICLVCVHLGAEMQPLTSKYLGACFSSLSDRNATVRKYYASAIGHLIGTAKEQSIERLFKKLEELYFEQQVSRSKAVPLTIQAINKWHQEVLKDYSGHVLPLVFFAMHEEVTEESKSTVELWQELWHEINTGDAGLRMNLDAIVTILETNLNNPSWLLKAQAGAATNTLASKMSASLDEPVRLRLIDLILNNVTGRTFLGKEKLLQALAGLCKKLNQEASNHGQRIVDAVMKECRKEEAVYRTHALRSLGNILDELKVDRFEEVYNMVWHLLDKQQDSSDKAGSSNDNASGEYVTTEERSKQMLILVQLKETVCETLGKAWPENSIETQRRYQKMFVEKCVQCLKSNTRQVQLSLLQALGRFLERLALLRKEEDMTVNTMEVDEAADASGQGGNPDASGQGGNREKKAKVDHDQNGVLESICRIVLAAIVELSAIPHTGLKKEALNIMLILAKKLKAKERGTVDTEMALVQQTFAQILTQLQKDTAPEVKCRLKDLEDKLK
ncbi:proteasome-associated protein ECM29 homolog isoform X1 [Anopheles ziemanni]|uniref:proteasome-associated protein ECM29 homolog isoform X1 n=1 Tax=Anopheles coustani TaxID=139045 RepID=UPI00265B2987|nr:proteasome-associated protein ECM29 homolog isoform X1 [Anopheles coustani]XP_058175366.1 proteasome-associated protein ECM29 homolog isoform X1 [Anopheles ziemanni]